MSELTKIRVTDGTSLEHVCALLHDASCDSPSRVYDAASGTWRALFARLTDDRSRVRVFKRGLIWDRLAIPLVESELLLDGVVSCTEPDSTAVGDSFSHCERVGDGYALSFHEGLRVELTFQMLPHGSLTDLRDLAAEDTSIHVSHRQAARLTSAST